MASNTSKNVAPDYGLWLTVAIYVIIVASNYKKMTMIMPALSLGVGCIIYAMELPGSWAAGAASITLLLMIFLMKDPNTKAEGFNTRTGASEIASAIRSKKQAYKFSGAIEGYEDVKKEKDEKPAPANDEETQETNEGSQSNGDNIAMPFKLGEIPSQVKNGPHLDVASTLVTAIKSLNPDQINAMSKDTKQLIETQKSLMNMMGSMKPMLNDGKELMDTFQQMFGKN
jgi:hypothetical protein